MDAIEKRARELYAKHAERQGYPMVARQAREGLFDSNPSMLAIVEALTPPEGYVLVPVEPTPEMELAIVDWLEGRAHTGDCYAAILAARPDHIAHDLKMVTARPEMP